jgi:hypothetical protein
MKNKGNSGEEKGSEVTIDDVRAIDAFKNLTDEQAGEVVEYIKIYCELVYTAYQIQKSKQKNQNSKNHSDDSTNQKQAA